MDYLYIPSNLIFMINFINLIYFYYSKIISLFPFIKLAQNCWERKKRGKDKDI